MTITVFLIERDQAESLIIMEGKSHKQNIFREVHTRAYRPQREEGM